MPLNPSEWPFAPGTVREVERLIAEFGKDHYPQCGWHDGAEEAIARLALDIAVGLSWPLNDPVAIVGNVLRTIKHLESGATP